MRAAGLALTLTFGFVAPLAAQEVVRNVAPRPAGLAMSVFEAEGLGEEEARAQLEARSEPLRRCVRETTGGRWRFRLGVNRRGRVVSVADAEEDRRGDENAARADARRCLVRELSRLRFERREGPALARVGVELRRPQVGLLGALAMASGTSPFGDAMLSSPRLRVSVTSESETLPEDAVRAGLEAQRDALEACAPHTVAAPWHFRLSVSRRGRVEDVQLDEQHADEALARAGRCLEGVLARLRFERRQGPPRVEVRVELRRPPTAIGGLAGAGGLGLRGTGRGGGGTGEGTLGLGSRGRGEGGDEGAVERVRFGRVDVRGPLPREAVRRVLRRHERELLHCYATARREQPELAGRLLVEFEIGPQGRIGSARVTEDGLGHAALAQCVVRRLRRWRFPRPDVGGTVHVHSPFVFATGPRPGAPPDAEARPAREEDATPPSRPRGQLDPARPTIRGALSREVIQRVVRQHANEARYCYERRLGEHPGLAGRLVLRFVISPEGRVASASVDEDTLGDAAVGACLAHAVRRWRFPRPSGGGIVLVRYPFVFRPD